MQTNKFKHISQLGGHSELFSSCRIDRSVQIAQRGVKGRLEPATHAQTERTPPSDQAVT